MFLNLVCILFFDSPSISSDKHDGYETTAKRMFSHGKINGNSLAKTTLTGETNSRTMRVSYVTALRKEIFRQNSRRRQTRKTDENGRRANGPNGSTAAEQMIRRRRRRAFPPFVPPSTR